MSFMLLFPICPHALTPDSKAGGNNLLSLENSFGIESLGDVEDDDISSGFCCYCSGNLIRDFISSRVLLRIAIRWTHKLVREWIRDHLLLRLWTSETKYLQPETAIWSYSETFRLRQAITVWNFSQDTSILIVRAQKPIQRHPTSSFAMEMRCSF